MKKEVEIDGSKLFEAANQFDRQVSLGTENQNLKAGIKWSKDKAYKRHDTVIEFIKKLSEVNR